MPLERKMGNLSGSLEQIVRRDRRSNPKLLILLSWWERAGEAYDFTVRYASRVDGSTRQPFRTH
jgi:hypothetical protein